MIISNMLLKGQFAFVVAHIETALELANFIQPTMIPIPFIIRSADNIAKIILNPNTDSKFMNLVLTQAYILLDAAMSSKSFKGKVRIFVKIIITVILHTFLLLKNMF